MAQLTAVVIPNWNGADFIAPCIDGLLAQTHPPLIIVVENGSHDNSMEVLGGYKQKITVLEEDHNHGFAGGVNIGIRYALKKGCKYIALLNNDAVPSKDWLEHLVQRLDSNPGVGIATSKIMIEGTRLLDTTGDWYTTTGMPFPRGRHEPDEGQYDNSPEVFGASGGASLYRAELFEQIGLFDEDFFAYYEDVDLSFRAQLRGWKVRYVPEAVVYHKLSATSSRMGDFTIYQSAKNFWLTYVKDLPLSLLIRFFPAALYRYARMFAARLIRGGFLAFIRGFLRAMILMPRKLRERRAIQSGRTVSIEYVSSIIYKGKPPVTKVTKKV